MKARKRKKNGLTEEEKKVKAAKFAELVERFNIGTYGDYVYVDMHRFFRILFERQGEMRLQERGKKHYKDGHYNAIIRRIGDAYKTKRNWWVVTDSLYGIENFRNAKFSIVSPVTYVGFRRTLYGESLSNDAESEDKDSEQNRERTRIGNARYLFAFAIDLDSVYVKNMGYLARYISIGQIPQPTMITCSGSGLHVYYCLQKPIAITKDNIGLLNRFKVLLTMMLWHYNLTSQKKNAEYHDINQGYRFPETQTKFGRTVHTYALEKEPYYTIRELNGYILHMHKARPDYFRVKETQMNPLEDIVLKYIENDFAKDKLSPKELIQLDECVRLPAHWSKNTAIQKFGQDWWIYVQKNGSKDWKMSPKLYYWWLNKLRYSGEVEIGHRYWCIYILACWAYNCHISYDTLKADAQTLLQSFNMLRDADNMPDQFSEKDLEDALEVYKERKDDKIIRLNREKTERVTGISIPANKRNYRNRSQHGSYRLKCLEDSHDPKLGGDGANWREGNGRPPKADVVAEWRATHPKSDNKSLCARELQIDLKTVRKWWNYTAEDSKAESDREVAIQQIGLSADAKKPVAGYEIPDKEPSELHDLGAGVNYGYVTDKKIAAAAMQNTEGYESQDAETIRKTGDELADAINFGPLNAEDLMRAMGVPEFMIPMMKAEMDRQMQTPEFWEQYRKARPDVDMSAWPPEARQAYEAAVAEHRKKK